MRKAAVSVALAVAVIAPVYFAAMPGAALSFGWGSATLIELGVYLGYGPQVGVDPSGNAVAVWSQFDGTRYNIWANRFVPGTGWSTATLIETDNTGDAGVPQVAVDAGGTAIAMWIQSDGTRNNIWANRFVPGTGWSTATLIETDNAGGAVFPQIAVDAGGTAIAVWQQSDGTQLSIWANRFVPGTGWSTATLIEMANAVSTFDPQVAVDPGGRAVAVWSQFDGIRYNIWANRFVPGTGWSTTTLIETDDAGDAYVPQVAVDSDGNAIVVWAQFDGTHLDISANRFVPGIGWSIATLIETGAAGAIYPQIAVDPSGTAFAVWSQFEGTRTDVWANRFIPGTGWGTATRIETNDAGDAYVPQVAVDSSGNAVAVWYQFDGTGQNIYANRYVRDDVAPSIDLGSPLDGQLTQNSSVTVSGATEPGAAVTVNGAAVSVSGDGGFSVVVALAEGMNTITVVSTDAEGNSANVVRSVTRDSTPPALAVTSPAPGTTVGANVVQVSGTVSDATSGVVALVVDGLQVDPVSPWNVNVALTDGPQAIVVLARDAAGNSETMSVSITYVNPLPGLQEELRDTRTALNATRDELDVVRDELTATQGGLAAANARAEALGSLTLALAVLLSVAIAVALLQFVLYRRRRGRIAAETPPSPDPKDDPNK